MTRGTYGSVTRRVGHYVPPFHELSAERFWINRDMNFEANSNEIGFFRPHGHELFSLDGSESKRAWILSLGPLKQPKVDSGWAETWDRQI